MNGVLRLISHRLKFSISYLAQDYVFKLNPCGANEVLNECGKLDYCDGTCANPKSQGISCPDTCVKRCECKEGFVRASYNSNMTCVAQDSCPKLEKLIAGFCTFSNSLQQCCPPNAECPIGYLLKRKGSGCCCEEFTLRKFFLLQDMTRHYFINII
jgi:Trypsin Inhibitor like cysteine rich domain